MAAKSTSPFAGLDKALLRSTKQSPPPPPQKDVQQETAKAPKPDTTIPRHHDTAVSPMPPRNQDTTVADAEDDILNVVRKAVRQIGKEAATHRFTLNEKNSLAEIEYIYRRQGIRTSENEITRIAINYFHRRLSRPW
jgi:hypothetical protein